jgi:hypothetical protein
MDLPTMMRLQFGMRRESDRCPGFLLPQGEYNVADVLAAGA